MALVLGNVVPLVGVLVWNWDVASLVMFYWSENLVIGAITILKLLYKHPIGGVFAGGFFGFHYGAFCAVHGFFALMLLGIGTGDAMSDLDWPLFLIFIQLLIAVVQEVFSQAPPEWIWGFTALAASHWTSFLMNYVWGGEHTHHTIRTLMSAPYGRIVVLHVAVLAGGFGVMLLGSPLSILLVLVVGKTVLDLGLHLREHRMPLRFWQRRAEAAV